MSTIRLIVGLGNPGPEYQHTRHNAGFWLVDELAWQWKASWRNEGKFFGTIARAETGGQEVWLLKPMTYMNLSGKAVSALARFYKIDRQEILVIHDELDLPPGTAKLKQGGGHGGHNGLKDITAQMGGNDFWRLRIGIGHPGDRNAVIGYVLNKPRQEELTEIENAMHRAEQVIPQVVAGQMEKAMHTLHTV